MTSLRTDLITTIVRNSVGQLKDCVYRLDDRPMKGSVRIELIADLPKKELVLAGCGPRPGEVFVQVLAKHGGGYHATVFQIHRVGTDTRVSFNGTYYQVEGSIQAELDPFLDVIAERAKALKASALGNG
jgi:hypothetical protein